MVQHQREAAAAPTPDCLIVATLPGGVPVWPVQSTWRAAVPTLGGLAAPEAVLGAAKAVALASRAERALVSALAADRGQEVLEQAGKGGDHQTAAAVAASLRLADQHPDKALAMLAWVRTGGSDPAHLRFMRRYLPGMRAFVALSPEIHAVIPADSTGLGLLQVELLRTAGNDAEAVALLQTLERRPDVLIARVAQALAAGEYDAVVGLTDRVTPTDDASALVNVLRARALRATGRVPAAVETVERALAVRDTGQGFRIVALNERAEALRTVGRTAEADMSAGEHQALLTSITEHHDVGGVPPAAADQSPDRPVPSTEPPRTASAPAAEPPAPATSSPTGAVAAAPAGGAPKPQPQPASAPQATRPRKASPLHGRDLADAVDDARARVRRQPRWGMAPGMFGGRPHRDYLEEVDELIRAGQVDAAESLLLGLLDAVDAEVDRGEPVDDTHFLTLAGLFARGEAAPEELATLERLVDSYRRSGAEAPEPVRRRIDQVRVQLRALEQSGRAS